MPTCVSCRFWDTSTQLRNAQPDTTGMCRCSPPRINKRTGAAMWPHTEDSDWCGAYATTPALELDPEAAF